MSFLYSDTEKRIGGINKMQDPCIDCGAPLDVPDDSLDGEIICCPDCGVDYVIEMDDNGKKQLTELTIEGEDWGE